MLLVKYVKSDLGGIIMDGELKRYSGIDLTKFICSFFVIMGHVPPFGVHNSSNIYTMLNFGLTQYICRLAVPFFFICNGYFLFRKIDFANPDSNQIKSRILKIIKLYIIWSAIYFPLSLTELIKHEKGFIHRVLVYIRDFLFMGSYVHLWYINGLIIALFIIAICLKLNLRPKAILLVSLFLYLIGLLDDSYYGLMNRIPLLSKVFEVYNKYFVTTRNGVFIAFFFVSLGMFISVKKPQITHKQSAVLFFISMLLMLIETFFLKYYSIARGFDNCIFLVPSVFFFFNLSSSIELYDSEKCSRLGTMSRLIYYGHLWVSIVILQLFDYLPEGLIATPLRFLMVVAITIMISLVVMKLSDMQRFKWLKKMY